MEPRRNIWLVDKENCGNAIAWIKLAEHMNRQTTVYVFYSSASNFFYLELIEAMSNKGVHIAAIKCKNGSKNALDFQLVSELGRLICENKSADFFIVSEDKGYDAVVWYWGRQGIRIKRVNHKDDLDTESVYSFGPVDRTDICEEIRLGAKIRQDGIFSEVMSTLRKEIKSSVDSAVDKKINKIKENFGGESGYKELAAELKGMRKELSRLTQKANQG